MRQVTEVLQLVIQFQTSHKLRVMSTFNELISQITAGTNLVENNITMDRWNKIEENIHFKFPLDYVKFINYYGTGRLCQLIWFLNPFSAYDRFNLLHFLKYQEQVFYKLKNEYGVEYPFKLFMDGSGLIPFAFSDNGDTIYWNIKDDNKKACPIIILDGRNTRSEEYHLSFNEFLHKILNKSLNSLILINDDIVGKNFDPLTSII